MKDLSYPFLRDTFLQALEDSGSVSAETGWTPIHLELKDKELNCFMPLYLKDHSMGEYVFDHAWANAYHQNGLDYYPKLVTAIPFTPSTGSRLRSEQVVTQTQWGQLVDEVTNIAEETQASSWHILFPNDSDLSLLHDRRLLKRSGVQYHWFNKGYDSFDDYLLAMTSRKRKMIRKERQEVINQGIDVKILCGDEITTDLWQLFYRLYERTYAKRNGTRGYLTSDFFRQIAIKMPEQIAMAVANIESQPIACALYLFDNDTLYGRYWGSLGEYPYLHFELCYYSGIELAIKMGLQRYDAGAQGEHKLVRGFEPVRTVSLHWIRHPEFKDAIARYLEQENVAIQQHIDQALEMLPFKKSL
ncbi:MAG: N-acetyltransferase [Porticoccaceae bacterium]|nr:N-acetyltransferase [Porticoccaceae bacterium]